MTTETLIRTDDGETATIQELRMLFEFKDWFKIECATLDECTNRWEPLHSNWWDNSYSTVVRFRARQS